MAEYIFNEYGFGSVADPKQRVLLTIEGVGSQDESLFIISAAGDIQANYQINYSLGPTIYVNTFQQRLVPMELKGVCLRNDACKGADKGDPAILRFYRENNIVNAKKLVRLTYDGLVLQGFMTKLSLGTYEKESMRGYTFSLSFLGYVSMGAR